MSKPGQSDVYRTSRTWKDNGYVVDWYDSRINVVENVQWISPYTHGYDVVTGSTMGHFGFVDSYRRKTPHPRNMRCNSFISERRSYDPKCGNIRYKYAYYVYDMRGLGAGYGWFKYYMTNNNLPSVETDDLIAKVSSDVFIQASEPYVPPVHWLGEMRETIVSMKRPLAGARKLGANLRRTLKRLYTSEKEVLKSMKTLVDQRQKAVNMMRGQNKLSKSHRRNLKRRVKKIQAQINDLGGERDRIINDVASAHLEFQFGMVPLVGMADTMAQKLADLNNEIRSELKVFKSSAREVITDEVEEFDHNGLKIRRRTIHTVSVRAQMTVRYVNGKPLDLGRFSLASMLQEVATQMWQLISLSFVVDWFVAIGKLLKECRPVLGNVVHSSYTVQNKRVEEVTIYDSTNPYYTVVRPCGITQTAISTKRVVGLTRPGKLRWGSGIDSIGKGLSLTSLIAGRIK